MTTRSDTKAEVVSTIETDGEDANYNGLTYKTIKVLFPIRQVYEEVLLSEGSVSSQQLFAEAKQEDVEDIDSGGTLELDGTTYNIIKREVTKWGSTILQLSSD